MAILSKNRPACFGGLLFFGEGKFSDGDLFLQEETGTLWNFFSVCRAVFSRIPADFVRAICPVFLSHTPRNFVYVGKIG
jgi:hypothetical protein